MGKLEASDTERKGSLAIDGASLKVFQGLAGHKDIKTTARYAHLSPCNRRIVMEHLAAPDGPKVVDFSSATRTANGQKRKGPVGP